MPEDKAYFAFTSSCDRTVLSTLMNLTASVSRFISRSLSFVECVIGICLSIKIMIFYRICQYIFL